MNRSRIATLIALSALAVCGTPAFCAAEQNPSPEDQIEELASSLATLVQVSDLPVRRFTLAERMTHHKIPGVSAAYFDDGRVVWADAWGEKDAGTGEKLTTDTLFQAASISKPVTAMTMLTLVEEGKLDLDEDVNKYLKSWKLPDNEYTREKKVTLRMIASHSAGLTVSGFPGYKRTDQIPTTIQILDGEKPCNTGPVRVDMTPGTDGRYSGGGYVLMGLLMEDVTGKPLTELVTSRVLKPLGMTRSIFVSPLPQDREKDAATAHDGSGKPVEGRYLIYPELGAAGLWTTPTDLARLAIAVQKMHSGKPGGILSTGTARMMLEQVMNDRGLGFAIRMVDGKVTAFTHGGANKGYRNIFFAHIAGDGMVVMTNGDNGGDLWREIMMAADSLYDWPEWEMQVRDRITLTKARLEALSGRYRVTEPVQTVVVIKPIDRGLSMQAIGFGQPEPHYPESETRWFSLTGSHVDFEMKEGAEHPVAILFSGIRAERIREED